MVRGFEGERNYKDKTHYQQPSDNNNRIWRQAMTAFALDNKCPDFYLGKYGTSYSKLNGQSWKGSQVPGNCVKH